MKTKLTLVPAIALIALLCPAHKSPSFATDESRSNTDAAAPDVAVVSGVQKALASPEADTRAAALAWIARDPGAEEDSLIPTIFSRLKDPSSEAQHEALRNMGWIYERHSSDATGREALQAILDAFRQTADRSARLVVVDLLRGGAAGGSYGSAPSNVKSEQLIRNAQIQSLVASFLKDAESTMRPQLLQFVSGSPTLQAVPAVVQGIGACLDDDNLTVRSNAVDVLIDINRNGRKVERDEAHPLLLAALKEGDPNMQLRASTALGLAVPPSKAQAPVLSLTGQKISTAEVPFDFNYFTALVQPLFLKKYRNTACVDCHTPQSNISGKFRVLAPGRDGRYTLEQSRVNFASVLAVIDRQNRDQSKLLLKPLDPNTREGSIRGMTHDGGAFWTSENDPDFQLVKDWLDGAKLETPPERQLSFTYFVQHVEPIFSTPGPDGIACINCHSTHAILHLLSPETREGKFSIQQLVNNYQSALRVVDETAAADSFIVRKPTSPREGESGGISHAGGVRWPGKKDSWQYKALLSWIGTKNLVARPSKQVAAR
jgi:hypothetical protein